MKRMKIMIVGCRFLMMFLLSGILIQYAIAQPNVDCTDPQGTPEINYCAELAYKEADAKLNQVYQKVFAELDKEAKPLLQKAQRAWIGFRDAHCESDVFDTRGGTGFLSYLSACLQAVTEQRTQYLQAWSERLR